ncbi:MAG: hypothetical protein JXA60_12235 [Candidatus Coatesbacteria bacterium]|nr:hypothetical protein [Candidatus Coatesbacteria bacterium]
MAKSIKLDKITTKEWEAICLKCGSCCFEKYYDSNGRLIFTDIPCQYLDMESMLCKIYKNRFEINPECKKLKLSQVKSKRYLPSKCAYLKWWRDSRKKNIERKK